MIRTNLWKLALCLVAGAVLALVVSLIVPKKYEGVVQILVDQSALVPSVPLTPVEASVKDLVDFSRSRGIATQVDQLSSLGVLEVAAHSIQEKYPNIDPNEIDLDRLQDNVSVSAETVSDLITLRVRMSSPELAQQMAAEIYNAFNDKNIGQGRVLGGRAVESLEMQSADIRTQLAEVDKQTQALRSQFQAPSIDAQIQADVTQLATLKERLAENQADLAGARMTTANFATTLAGMPKTVPGTTSVTDNPTALTLERDIAAVQADRAGLLEKYYPDQEDVRADDAKIKRLTSDLKRIQSSQAQTSSQIPNPERQQMALNLAQARAREASLQNTVANLAAAVQTAAAGLGKYPDIQKKMEELGRRQASLEKLYQDYQSQLQTMRARQSGRVATSSIVGGPMSFPQPVSPKMGVNTVLGALFGLAIGVLWMMLSEARNQPIRTISQLNALSFTPVYRLLPELRVPFMGLGRPVHESFERLLIHFRSSEKRPYRIGVVGLVRDSGASVTAANLAVSAVRLGSSAAIVEYDDRHPQKARFSRQGGESVGILAPSNDRLPHDADLVVYDFEPADKSAEYSFLAHRLDEAIVVVRANHVRSVDFLQIQQTLQDAGCPLITVVFSRASQFNAVSEPLISPEPEVQALNA